MEPPIGYSRRSPGPPVQTARTTDKSSPEELIPSHIRPVPHAQRGNLEPFSATWRHLTTGNIVQRREDLATKIDPALLDFVQTWVREKVDRFGISYLISLDRFEITVLNMLGNLVEAYEKEMQEPFPKEITIFALVNFIASKSKDAAVSHLFEKFQEIETAKKSAEEKKQEKHALYAELAKLTLSIAFPGGPSDLEFGYFNKKLWDLLISYAPSLLQGRIEPFLTTVTATRQKGKDLEKKIQNTHGVEILELARAINSRAKIIIAEKIVRISKHQLALAKTAVERKLYLAAIALGEGKGAHFTALKVKITDHIYPILLHLLDHLLQDKPLDVRGVTHILSQLLAIRSREERVASTYAHLLEGLSPEEISIALSYALLPENPISTEIENYKIPLLANFLRSRSSQIADDLGLNKVMIAQLIPVYGETAATMVQGTIALSLVEFFTRLNTPVSFPREIADLDLAGASLEAIFAGTVAPAMDSLLKNQADEDAEDLLFDPMAPTSVDPVKEATRLGSLVAGKVNEGVPKQDQIAADYFINAFSQLRKNQSYREFLAALNSFGAHILTNLLAGLAATNPLYREDNAPVPLFPAAFTHIFHILKEEIVDPTALEHKLHHWRRMPKETVGEQKAKELFKEKELLPLFQRAAHKITKAMNLDEPALLPLPEILREIVLDALKNQLVPEFLLDCAQGITGFSPIKGEDVRRLDEYTNTDDLNQLGNTIAQQAARALKPALLRNGAMIASSINESLTGLKLDAAQEAQIKEGILAVVNEVPDALILYLLQQILPQMLKKLSARYQGIYAGDAATAALLHLRWRFAEANLDPKIYSKIQDYVSGKVAIPARKRYFEELLQAFRPLSIDLLADLGITSGKELPLPSMAAAATYDSLVKSVIPNQLMRVYSDYLQFGVRSKEHKLALDARFKVTEGKKHSGVVNALTAYAAMAVHFADNWLVVNAEQVMRMVQAGVQTAETPPDKRALPIPGQAIKARQRIIGGSAPTGREFLFPLLRKEIKGALFDIVNNFSKSLERVEDHANFGPFMLDVVKVLTRHVRALNSAAKGKFIHEIPASLIAEELERSGVAHPAYPNSAQFKRIEDTERQIEGLPEHSPARKRLIELNRTYREEMGRTLEKTFYRGMTRWFLKMAGKHRAQDLAVSPLFQEKLWELLHNDIGPMALRSTFESLGSPEMINQFLNQIVVNLNKQLDHMIANKNSPALRRNYAEYPGASAVFKDLLSELGRAIPGTWTEWILEWKKVRKILGDIIESNVREYLVDWSFRSIMELALTEPDKDSPLVLEVTKEELAHAKIKKVWDDIEAIENFSKNAGRLPSLIKDLINAKAKSGWGAWAAANLYPRFAQSLELSFSRTSEPLRKSIVDVQAHSNLILNIFTLLMHRYPAPPPETKQ